MSDVQLSPHFTLAEMTRTATGFPNQPDADALAHLKITADGMEEVREFLGHPIQVDSGYRSPEVNASVRGVKTSAHCQGWACDFTCQKFGTPFEAAMALARSGIQFDQLILEYGWVHISFDPRMRGEVLTKHSATSPYELGINP